MGTYPVTPRSAFLDWCQAHADLFETKYAQIGMTAAQAAAFKAATEEAAAAVIAQTLAKQDAESATGTAGAKFTALRAQASAAVRSIRTFAENSGNPEVYSIANINPPAPPGPTPPPGTPYDPRITLMNSGGLSLRWTCNNPGNVRGIIYEVQRRIGPAGPFAYIGASGVRSFQDEMLPAGIGGAASVTYRITGVRSTQRGSSADFIVNFGATGGGGYSVLSVTEVHGAEDDMKIAA